MRTQHLMLVAAVAFGACTTFTSSQVVASAPDSIRIRNDIRYLASDALEGRGTGTPGNDSAAAFAAKRYAALGLRALAPGYFQPFEARSAMMAHSGGSASIRSQNIVAM